MALELPNLSLKVVADTSNLEQGLRRVKTVTESTKRDLDSLGNAKLNVAPTGGRELQAAGATAKSVGRDLDTAKGSATGLAQGLSQAAGSARGLQVPTQPKQELAEASKQARGLSESIGGTISKLGAMAGAAAGIASVGAAFKNVIEVGADYQRQMNTLSAVTQASPAQLAAVSAKARELGSDTSLTATSASDAAAAMTELAKGGFSVEQSMTAAKGTLQLAAAAQVDAASAATIQSQALQSFGLDASNAARVSDILAGAANASSAEMTGIAQGLQQSGTVARQFGINIDDTATALAMFANAGIQGSDAGTLLKTALLALTDQGKPAQAAIKDLGLSVYNAKGEFVGLPSLFEQLADAQKRMTPEAYQAASATLFGSDAMRLAGIGAQQGREGFEKLREAVIREGQAAEVAAAQTAGLPGAMERVQNTAEEVYLGIYDVIQGPLTQGLDIFSRNLATAGEGMATGLRWGLEGLKDLADTAGPAISQLSKLTDVVSAAPGAFTAMAAAFALNKFTDFSGKMDGVTAAIGKTKQAAAEGGRSISSMGAAFQTLRQHSTVIDNMAASYTRGAAPLNAVAAHHRAAAAAAKAHALAEKEVFTSIDLMGQQAAHSMAASTAKMTAPLVGLANGGLSLVKSGINGVVGALGGPWGIAMMAGAAAVGQFVEAQARSKAANESMASAVKDAAEAHEQLRRAAAGSSGELNKQAQEATAKIATASLTNFTAMGKQLDGLFSSLDGVAEHMGKANASWAEQNAYANALKASYGDLKKVTGEMGISIDDLGKVVAEGGPKYNELLGHLNEMGPSGDRAARALTEARAEVIRSVESARELSPAYKDVAEAVDVLADKASKAEDKVAALEKAMQAIGLAPKNAEKAMRDAAEAADELAEKAKKTFDLSKGSGMGLFGDDGKLNMDLENARTLSKELETMRGQLQNVAASGGDTQKAFDSMQGPLHALADSLGLPREKMDELAQSYGLLPKKMDFFIAVQGGGEAAQSLMELSMQLDQVPTGKEVVVKPMTDQATDKLRELGFQIDAIPGSENVSVTATTDQAKTDLESLAVAVAALDGKEAFASIMLDTTPLVGSAQAAEDILQIIGDKEVTPQADLILDKMLEGKDIAVNELAVLSQEKALPTADLEKTLLDNNVVGAHEALDTIKNRPTDVARIEADGSQAKNEISTIERMINSIQKVIPITFVGHKLGFWGNSTGGYAGLPGFSSGGQLPTSGPGTDSVDGILGVGSDGIPTAWVDRGEFVTKRERTQKFPALLRAVNNGTAEDILAAAVAEVPRLADGGSTSSDRVKQALSGMKGTPYIFGGWSTAGVDCSGAVSMAVNAWRGLDPLDSRCATASEAGWLSAKGFLPGRGGPGDFVVGFYNGGEGGGHTAAMLPDGTYIESGGNTGGGLTIGPPAGPLDGRGFTDWFHAPDDEAGLTGDDPDSDTGTGSDWQSSYSTSGGSSGGSVSRRSRSSRPAVSISDGSMTSGQAARRMGLTGGGGGGTASGVQGAVDTLTAGLAGLFLVTEDTVAAFNELEKAREEEKAAAEDILQAEKELEEARKKAVDAGGDAAEKIADKERALAKAREGASEADKKAADDIAKKEEALAKAREKGDPEKIRKAEEALAEAREKAPKKAGDAAEKIAKAERDLAKAREDAPEKARKASENVEKAEENLRIAREESAASADRTAAAERKYKMELAQAPFKQAESVFNAFGGLFSAFSDIYKQAADRERQKLEQAKEALSIWQQQIDAQISLQNAMEASNTAIREQAKSRWQSDLAVSDAEWEMTLHRKRSVKELAEASLFSRDVSAMEAKQKRHTAVLEAQISFEKAKRDLVAFEREMNLASAAAELEHSHKVAAIQTSKLALVSTALARIQGALNIEEMKALEAKALKAQGMATTANGLGGVVGGIGGIIGALGMAAANPIGALVAGLGAIGGIISGMGQMRAGREQVKAAQEQEEALKNIGKGNPKLIEGLDSNSLEALDLQEQQLQIMWKQDQLQRQKDNAKQHELLRQLVDNSEKNLEYAKRDEQHANDLEALEDSGSSGPGSVVFRIGQHGWDGRTLTARQLSKVGGFGGLGAERNTSWQFGDTQPTGGVVNLGGNRPEQTLMSGAEAQVVTAQHTRNIEELAAEMVDYLRELTRQGGKPQQAKTVFSGPVSFNDGSGALSEVYKQQAEIRSGLLQGG